MSQDQREIAVYWGRFNPPHRGHLEVIRKFKDRYRLVVAIGSSERRNLKTDPFSGVERKAMMEAYLEEEGIQGVRVVTLKDGPSWSWAIRNLLERCEPDVLLLSEDKEELANKVKGKVRVVQFPRTGKVSSTWIRDSIASGERGWKQLTGRSVAALVVKFNGVHRIQRAYRIKAFQGKAQ